MKCVYFIFQEKPYDLIKCKIGSTKRDSDIRCKELQTGNPDTLYVYKTMPTPYYKEWETFIQFTLTIKHIKGEWYNLTESDVDILCNMYEKYSDHPPPKFTLTPPTTSNKKRKSEKIEKPEEIRCYKCDQVFTSEKRYKNHINNVLNPCNNICIGCGLTMSSRRALGRHKKTCNPYKEKRNTAPIICTCEKCGKSMSEGRYKNHIANILNPCDNKCFACEAKFSNRQSFYRHKKKCKPYQAKSATVI